MNSSNTSAISDHSKLTRSSLASDVYLAIRASLANGELEPNHRLNVRALSEQLGVSQTPVREAMLQLVAERALTLNRNRSVTVPVLSPEQFIELRDIRVALESLAVRFSAQNVKAPDIQTLTKLHQQMAASRKKRDFKTTLRLNRQFHFSTYQLSLRPELIAMIDGLWVRTGPYLALLYEYENKNQPDQIHSHELLLKALAKHDPDAAAAAITEDIVKGGAPILEGIRAINDHLA